MSFLNKCWYFARDRVFFSIVNPFCLNPFLEGRVVWSINVDRDLSSHCVKTILSMRDGETDEKESFFFFFELHSIASLAIVYNIFSHHKQKTNSIYYLDIYICIRRSGIHVVN